MSKRSVAFGKLLRKYIYNPSKARRILKTGLSAEFLRRKTVAVLKNDFSSWMDYCALQVVQKAIFGKNVVWVNLLFPVEILLAFDLHPVSAEGLAGAFASMLLEDVAISKAESMGIARNMCTFHRTSLGINLLGIFPKPLFVATTNVLCDGNIPTFYTHSRLFNIKFFLLDIPRKELPSNKDYVTKQLEDFIVEIEKLLNKKFDMKKLKIILEIEKETHDILREVYQKFCEEPIKMKLYQHVNIMYSLHVNPSLVTLKAARSLLKGYPTYKNVEKRLLWLYLTPYYDNELYEIFGEKSKFAVVTSELEWDWLDWKIDTSRPLETLADKLLKNYQTGSLERRLQLIKKLALDFKVDGVIQFNHWGCKQSSGSVSLIKEELGKIGIPFLSLDGDCVDHNNQSAAQYKTKVNAFLEMIS
ncbi:2-hydroxyacyl-CoA dehydratase subunit D [Pseudothermotoga thermarum]|uniref:2-hydroxyglutaryl-CoA dehydratase D-component n=1 Tax=Pseudothermotoga thermarum DSM 5069 TaxID=688269 RepID=F7YUV3_9THEM|nr:2-hydroxyacyl-CoA dehydratase family protein [Pseudothermotoga thermarum]AEH51513.1 2-hydroxyglutaryl-CoA dehydratase D-component [Pseudothermotoga thermarum DSM 5069]